MLDEVLKVPLPWKPYTFSSIKPYKPLPAQALPLCENGLSLVQKPRGSFISLCDIRVLRERIIAISRKYYIEKFPLVESH